MPSRPQCVHFQAQVNGYSLEDTLFSWSHHPFDELRLMPSQRSRYYYGEEASSLSTVLIVCRLHAMLCRHGADFNASFCSSFFSAPLSLCIFALALYID